MTFKCTHIFTNVGVLGLLRMMLRCSWDIVVAGIGSHVLWGLIVPGMSKKIAIFILQKISPLLHGLLLLVVAVVADVADNLRGVPYAERLRIIGHLSNLSLFLLKVGMVLHLALNLCILRQATILGSVGDRRSSCNGRVSVLNNRRSTISQENVG